MRSKISSVVCFLAIIFIFQVNAQESFPSSWEGKYEGELSIYGVDSIQMQLAMKLSILKKSDSIYQWKMTYIFDGKEDIRDYELHIKDERKGHFVIDEKNTIVIDGYYRTGIFTSFFSVNDSFIISTYTELENDLQFEIIAVSGKNPLITGNQEYLGKQIPEVKSYLVNGRQKAILKRL